MVKRKAAKRVIDQNTYNQITKEHLLYLRGDDTKRADFSNCILKNIDMSGDDLSYAIFRNADLNSLQKYFYHEDDDGNEHEIERTSLYGTNLAGADFSGADVIGTWFREAASLNGAIFVGANFNQNSFSEEQLQQIILTEKELQLSRELKTATEQTENAEKTIEMQDIALEQTSKESVAEISEIFSKLKEEYSIEERSWMVFVGMTFFTILILSFFPVLHFMGYLSMRESFTFFAVMIVVAFSASIGELLTVLNGAKKEIGEGFLRAKILPLIDKYGFLRDVLLGWVILMVLGHIWGNFQDKAPGYDFKEMLVFLPLELVLISFLYFSIVQYRNSKKLRIEQQNKLAMIQFYVAHEAKGNKEHMSILLPKFADVLIREAMPDKNSSDKNLPIDEMIKIAELAVKNK